MYVWESSICRVQYYLWFQECTGGVLGVSRVEKGGLLSYQLRELERLLDSENNLHTHV